MGTPAEAEEIVARHRIGLVALCPGNAESDFARRTRARTACWPALLRGKVPDWLESIRKAAGKPLEIYRV